MAQFIVALLNDRLLQRATRDLMWTPLQTSDGKGTGYALGWGTGNDLGTPNVGHGGGQQGTSTYILIVPERKAGVVVLINLESADSSALATELMKTLLGIAK
jgi:CubicO group peptidase (beta-lactamase class C family)